MDEADQFVKDRYQADHFYDVYHKGFKSGSSSISQAWRSRPNQYGNIVSKLIGGSYQRTHGGKDEDANHQKQKDWLLLADTGSFSREAERTSETNQI